MHRTFPRIASFGVLATLLIPLLPAQTLAQRHIGGCGGGGGNCTNTYAVSDAFNPKFPGCAIMTSGSLQAVSHLGSDYEGIQETGLQLEDGTQCGCGEWVWVFDNVPGGPRYLRFKGYSDVNTYSIEVRFCDAGNSCPGNQLPCPWDVYSLRGTITPGTAGDTLHTVSLGNDNYAGRVCVLLQSQGGCTTADHVHMDLVMITNDPACNIP